LGFCRRSLVNVRLGCRPNRPPGSDGDRAGARGLNLTDDLAAGGFRFEQLPNEAFEGQAQVEDAITAVGPSSSEESSGAGRKSRRCCWSWPGGLRRLGWSAAQTASRERKAGKQVCDRAVYYRLLDTSAILFGMKNHTANGKPNTPAAGPFQDLGWITKLRAGPRAGSRWALYQWTRKVGAKPSACPVTGTV